MLRSNLALWAYTAPVAGIPPVVGEYGEAVEGLEFSTVSPGGFGDLSCVLHLVEPRLPRPELGLFGRVSLRDGFFTAFAGEWTDPALVLDASGEHVLLSALGGGVALRDDPDDVAYPIPSTAQAIIASEMSRRAAFLPLDQDQAAILPNNPALTFTPVYDGLNLEEILHDLMGSLGDYVWEVWDHPQHSDPAGFPTWQLRATQRDLATTTWQASGAEVVSWHVASSAQRAYNVIQLAYIDPVSGPASVTVSDPRLAPSGTQGTAPFRRRKLRRAITRVPLTASQATGIANAWLSLWQNPTGKIEVTLAAVRDAQGNPAPLHQVRAGGTLFLPELAPRGMQLGAGPQPGVNQFWIAETVYREARGQAPHLTLQLDGGADRADALLARLQLDEDSRQRQRGVYRVVQSPGAQLTGFCSVRSPSAAAGQVVGAAVSFVPVLSATPTGLSFTALTSANVASGPTVTAGTLTPYGCEVTVTAAGSGACFWAGRFTTIGA